MSELKQLTNEGRSLIEKIAASRGDSERAAVLKAIIRRLNQPPGTDVTVDGVVTAVHTDRIKLKRELNATIDALTKERDEARAACDAAMGRLLLCDKGYRKLERERNAMLPVVKAAMEHWKGWSIPDLEANDSMGCWPERPIGEATIKFRHAHAPLAKRIEESK